MNFLADLFDKGYQYRSLNSYCSAISSAHDKIDGVPVGQHPLVTRLLAGAFNSRPPQPRYTSTWNVDTVISYLDNLGSNKDLLLKYLTLMLMALTHPSRSADLCLLNVDLCRQSPEGLIFSSMGLMKLAHPQKVGQDFFPSFADNFNICPVTSTISYMKRTSSLRSQKGKKVLAFFISWVKPHQSVTSATIVWWLRTVLIEAGIDTSIFKAHSTRGASASAAVAAGVTTKDILNAADWSMSLFSKDFIASPSKATIMAEPFLLEAIKLQRTPLICETDLLKYNFRMAQAAEQLHAIRNYMKKGSRAYQWSHPALPALICTRVVL